MKDYEKTNSCETTLKVGDVLNNKWVILNLVDKGGMGEVYRAHQINLNRDVAIKVVSREWLKSLGEGEEEAETLVQRFRREVQAMAQISHPNVLQVFDYDSVIVEAGNQDEPIEYIAMEYMAGGSLRATMSEDGFYPDEAAVMEWMQRYFLPVLDGVKALHDKGIVHRDLKPENVFLDQDTPKIADFGLARSSRLKPVTQSMDVKGSPNFMSPEHFFDFKRADQRADVYSLGKILFEAVEGKIKTGTTPFKTVNLAKTESAFFEALNQIIQQATAEGRDERTESVQELRRQLEQALDRAESQKQIENETNGQPAPLQQDETTNACKTTLKVGDVLNGKWVTLNLIDKGGMGEVYRAHQINLNRDVAIKVVSREWLESLDEGDEEAETLVQRFRREVQAMAQISHPNVLQVFDHDSITVEACNRNEPIEYIAMEYMAGGSLRATMSEDGFYPDEAAVREWMQRYFLPVLDGVKALHDKGIVHRDLKPENIFLDQDTPKIADFGLARSSRLKPVTQSMDVKGSPNFMSPEHFFDFKRADQRADVYSLGKILFEAVEGKIKTGTTPFKTVNLAKTESAFFEELNQIIQQATAEGKDDRIGSVEELRRQLEQALDRAESQKEIENETNAQPAPLLSHPKLIWTGIVVTMLSVLLFTVWHMMGEPDLHELDSNITNIAKSMGSYLGNLASKAPSVETMSPRKPAELNAPPVFEHLEKRQHLVSGGVLTVPAVSGKGDKEAVQVFPFYMDEFFVTNQQFVDFLNHNLSQINVENGVVKGSGANWFLLGEIHSGYEPIVYRNHEFQVNEPAHASSPVLRVTGYGAAAFAAYFGRRLPTGEELLFAILKGGGSSAGGLKANEASDKGPGGGKDTRYLLTGASFTPNLLGIRGLNQGIGEWTYRQQSRPTEDPSKMNNYAVVGGVEGAPKDANSLPAVVDRFPWEGHEDMSFRTVKSAAVGNSGQ